LCVRYKSFWWKKLANSSQKHILQQESLLLKQSPMQKPILDEEMKKMFIGNIIKFFIGIWLLSICFAYLQKHPAEKASVLSWFEVMYQKWTILRHKFFYDDADLLEKKLNLQKYYKELVRTSEDCKWIDVETIEKLRNDYNSVKELRWDTMKNELAEYIRLVYKYESIVNQNCE